MRRTWAVARKELRQGTPDVVLLDLMLGDEDGAELLLLAEAEGVVGLLDLVVLGLGLGPLDELLALLAG